jgi:Spy/CpxP family protein refolding chaperone
MVNTWKIILATVVIFGAGVITGGLLVDHASRAKAKPPREFQVSLEQRRIEFLLNATRELKLSPEQRQRIEHLVRESQERTRKLWEQVGPEMRKELAEVREKIREELTPPQRKRFEELMKRQQLRRAEEAPPAGREKREGRRPPPGEGFPPAGAPPFAPPPASPPGPNR